LCQQTHRVDEHVQPFSLLVAADEDQPLSITGGSAWVVRGDSHPVEQDMVNIESQVLSDKTRRVGGYRDRHIKSVEQSPKYRTEIAVAS
jgi:hypothetical protein